jgi:hypothetical protein
MSFVLEVRDDIRGILTGRGLIHESRGVDIDLAD